MNSRRLTDHRVGRGRQRVRNGEAERFGGFEVDEELDLCGLLHMQVAALFAPKKWGCGAAERPRTRSAANANTRGGPLRRFTSKACWSEVVRLASGYGQWL
jgi:hypothetical protein